MKFDLRNLSLKTLTSLAFGLLALVSLTHYFSAKSIRTGISEKIIALELSSELHNNIYLVVGLVNRIHSTNEAEAKTTLKSVLNRHQNQLSSLTFGSSSSNDLKALKDRSLAAMKKADSHWWPLKANISIFLDGGIQLDSVYLASPYGLIGETPEIALKLINTNSDTYIASLDDLNKIIGEELNMQQMRLNRVSFSFLLVELVLFLAFVLSIFKYFISPIDRLGMDTHTLADGLEIQTEAQRFDNELGAIEKGFDKLVHNLSGITRFVKEIGSGNLEATLERTEGVINEDSLEGALISMRDQMKLVQKEEAERKWATEGLAQFVEILRSTDTDVHELGDKIISKLVEYTNSNQGGIYLFNDNEENPALELISLYAFSNKKYEQKTIRLGEGVVGQTYLERKTTYLLEIPDNYINIVSGLGGANPKAILIVPLMVNDDIYGILEIASFNEYSQHEIDFIEKLGESIASTISGVKVNQRTKVLLEESQQLTEQMQSQEEEMRQNMEELTATQEEMARTEKEKLAQQSAIDENIGIAEYDAMGGITYSNNEYNKQIGYTKEQLQGLNIQSLLGQSVSDNYNGFLDKQASTGIVKTYSMFNSISVEGDKKLVELSVKSDKLKFSGEDVNDLEKTLRQQLAALDITQIKLDDQVKSFQNKAKTLLTATNILILDTDLEVSGANNAAADRFKKDKSELIGTTVYGLFPDFKAEPGKQVLKTLNDETFEVYVLVTTNDRENEYFVHWS
ncbi:MAG: GAF domain-containing protein [Bacteroidota bacterium]